MKPDTTAANAADTLLPQTWAVALLLMTSTLFAANHIGARLAFDDGVGVPLAVMVRSLFATTLMLALVLWQRQRLAVAPGKWRWILLLGLMVGGQSLSLYSAVARIPVAVALLLMNTWPILLALLTWILGGSRPSRGMVIVMSIILVGMVLVLDAPAWLEAPSTLGPQWLPGVGLALSAAMFFAVAIWVTENRLSGMNGAVRSAFTMMIIMAVLVLGAGFGLLPGPLSMPQSGQGWIGLGVLMVCYGVASTLVFVLVPRLNMPRNAPVMNFETVASLLLGYLILGQALGSIQLLGGALVFGSILWLGFAPAARGRIR